MTSPIHETIFLMLSNLIFLMPSFFAYRRKLGYEGTVYLVMAIISTFYHYVDTGYTLLHYGTWHILDFYNASMMISRTGLMVFYNTDQEQTPEGYKRNTMIKQICHVLIDNIGLLLVLENVSMGILVTVLSILVALIILVAVIWFRDNLEHIDVWDLSTGALFLIIGSGFFMMGDQFEYWITHSLWHIFAGLGISLMVEALNRKWSLLKWAYNSCCWRQKLRNIPSEIPRHNPRLPSPSYMA